MAPPTTPGEPTWWPSHPRRPHPTTRTRWPGSSISGRARARGVATAPDRARSLARDQIGGPPAVPRGDRTVGTKRLPQWLEVARRGGDLQLVDGRIPLAHAEVIDRPDVE